MANEVADHDTHDERMRGLVQLLGHMRSTLIRYVRDRRAVGVPVDRVLAEVQDLVRQAAVLEAWCDPIDTLMEEAIRCTITTYLHDPVVQHGPRVD